MSPAPIRASRLTARMRDEERVTPLELFFDLVFVLALTQCTAFMADNANWEGLAKGVLLLGLMWWSWVGYAWLTSVVDPEEGAVRLSIFASMAAFLLVALAIPEAFDDSGFLFAAGYAVVRWGQIMLFLLASRENPGLRRSVQGLAVGTAIGTGLVLLGAIVDNDGLRLVLWSVSLGLDMAGPYVFGSEGWTLEPGHFAERHGLIIIIALGESIVAIGAGVDPDQVTDEGVIAAAVLGVAVAAALWWLYFDVVALVAARRLAKAKPGRERNEIARDSFSYLHFPMVAGIVLVALGLKKTLGDVDDPLKTVPAVALLGGSAVYLLAHVAFRFRNVHRLSVQRLLCALVLVALIPAALELPSLVTVAILAVLLAAVIVYEVPRFAELRERLRHELAPEAQES